MFPKGVARRTSAPLALASSWFFVFKMPFEEHFKDASLSTRLQLQRPLLRGHKVSIHSSFFPGLSSEDQMLIFPAVDHFDWELLVHSASMRSQKVSNVKLISTIFLYGPIVHLHNRTQIVNRGH